jgi:peptidoglycan/LPS O-acetylase OafA/YrhL
LNHPPKDPVSQVWTGSRFAMADLLRGTAAACVVWHHLSLYAPQSDLADRFAPSVGYWLFNHALYAVAVFFVLSGLIASLDKQTNHLRSAAIEILARYLRLAVPYLMMVAAVLLTGVITSAIDWPLGQVDSFSWAQLLAHTVFLQDLLGYGNFSAGTWYLCIEFQWSCFVVGLGVLANRMRSRFLDGITLQLLVYFPLGVASAWYWSRRESYEATFLFFAAQYILGMLLGWNLQGKLSATVLLSYIVVIAVSYWGNPRPQLMVSLVVAGVLWLGFRYCRQWRLPDWLSWLSKVSFSLFLVHYLVNGLVLKTIDSWAGRSPVQAAGAMLLAFLCSLVAAEIFYRWIESPMNDWIKRQRKSLQKQVFITSDLRTD